MAAGPELGGGRAVVIDSVGELQALASRRGFLKLMGLGGALVLLPSVLAACQDDSGLTAPSVGNPVTIDFGRGDVAVLQFAFALEQLEADFYARVVNDFANSNVPAAEQALLADIRNHDAIHRDLIGQLLGADDRFVLARTYPGVNFRDRTSVLTTAAAFEDLGVAAYNGAAQYLGDAGHLLVAAKIASVEARHASAIRDLLNPKAGDSSGFAPSAFDNAFTPARATRLAQHFIVDVLSLANVPTTFAQGPNGNG